MTKAPPSGVLPAQACASAIERRLARRRRVADPGAARCNPPGRPAARRPRARAALQLPAGLRLDGASRRSRGSPSTEIDLRDGATLERDRPYLDRADRASRAAGGSIRARANPKSSTGRLDVFTRVLTDRSHRFDEIAAGYSGAMYLEVVPRTFAIRVRTGLALNQVRLMRGGPRLATPSYAKCTSAHRCCGSTMPRSRASRPLVRRRAVRQPRRVGRPPSGPSATGPARTACRSTSRLRGRCAGRSTGSRSNPEPGARIVLEPEVFYLLLSAEGCRNPSRIRGGDAGLRPDRRRAAHPLRGLFRPRLRLCRQSGRSAASVRRSRSARATCRSWSSTASRSASSPSSGWRSGRRALRRATSARTTRASRQCSASTSSRGSRRGEPGRGVVAWVHDEALDTRRGRPVRRRGRRLRQTTTSSSFKGEEHEVAQTIGNLQTYATANEESKICASCSRSPRSKGSAATTDAKRRSRASSASRLLRTRDEVGSGQRRPGHGEGRIARLGQEEGPAGVADQGRLKLGDRRTQ